MVTDGDCWTRPSLPIVQRLSRDAVMDSCGPAPSSRSATGKTLPPFMSFDELNRLILHQLQTHITN